TLPPFRGVAGSPPRADSLAARGGHLRWTRLREPDAVHGPRRVGTRGSAASGNLRVPRAQRPDLRAERRGSCGVVLQPGRGESPGGSDRPRDPAAPVLLCPHEPERLPRAVPIRFRARRAGAASDVFWIVVGHGKSCPRRAGNASVLPLRTVRALLPCARIEAVPHAGPPRAVAAAAGGGRPFRRDARAGGR